MIFALHTSLYAEQSTHSISGQIIDADNKQAVAYATVSLLNQEGRAIISTISDTEGRFTLRTLQSGAYKLYVTLVGYQSYIRPMMIEAATYDVEQISLHAGVQIDDVVIKGRPLINCESDRVVYDVSADPEASKVKMADIMVKIPLLRPNAGTGKLEYDGEPVAQILVNGMTDEIVNRSRQYTMGFIKADYMRTIEVIPPGSPEYGNTKPIVNIILDRPLPFGIAGEITANAATSGIYSPSVDLITKNKVGAFSANYRFNGKDSPRLRTATEREQFDSDVKTQRSATEAWNSGREQVIQLGYMREFCRNKLALQLSTNTSNRDNQSYNRSHQASYNADDTQLSASKTFSTTDNTAPWQFNGGGSLIYRTGAISNIGITYTYDKTIDNTLQTIETNDIANRETKAHTLSQQQSLTVKMYQALGNDEMRSPKLNAEVGFYKRLYENASHYSMYDPETDDFTEVETQFNGLEYTQRVVNGNISMISGRRKQTIFMVTASLRAEYINNKGVYLSTGNSKLNYEEFNLLPAASFVLRPRRTTYKIVYTTRVLRPDIAKLNPYRDESDPNNIRQGNPHLLGEYAHRVNMSVGRTFTTGLIGSYGVSYGIEHIGQAIESYTTVDKNNIATTSYGNIGSVLKQQATATFLFPFNRKTNGPVLQVTGGYSQTRYSFPDEKNKISGWQVKASILMLQIGRHGPYVNANYLIAPAYASAQNLKNSYYGTFDLSISKYFRKLKFGGQFAATDLFHGRRYVGETIGSEKFFMYSRRERQGRIFSIQLYWRFGRFRENDRVSVIDTDAYDMIR